MLANTIATRSWLDPGGSRPKGADLTTVWLPVTWIFGLKLLNLVSFTCFFRPKHGIVRRLTLGQIGAAIMARTGLCGQPFAALQTRPFRCSAMVRLFGSVPACDTGPAT